MITGWIIKGIFVNWGWEFPLEILVAMLVFVYGMKKRNRFWLRVVICALLYIALIMFVPNALSISSYSSIYELQGLGYLFYSLFWSIFYWAAVIVLFRICFDETLRWLIFCGVAAYCVQHASYNVFCILNALFLSDYNLGALWMQYIVMAACYIVFFFILKGSMKRDHAVLENRMALLIICVATLFVVVGLSLGISFYAPSEYDLLYRLYALSATLILLGLLFTMLSKDKFVHENYVIRHMWESDMKHYEAQKKDMELINIKIHDLKHGYATENESDMKTLLSYYDAAFATGREALDVVLTEKNYTCVKLGIVFTCLVNGSFLSFMEDSDIYSLFSNMLDNAIEAVQQLPEEMRQISVNASQKDDVLSLTETNYFNGNLKVENGEIVTSKKDNRADHGFGLKSIKYVAGKYGGSVKVDAKDSVYCISIMFFVSDQAKTEDKPAAKPGRRKQA